MADDFNSLVEGLGGEGKDFQLPRCRRGGAGGDPRAVSGGAGEGCGNLEPQISDLQSQNATQQAQIAALEARLAVLEQRVGGANAGGLSTWGIGAALFIGVLGVVVYERVRRGGKK